MSQQELTPSQPEQQQIVSGSTTIVDTKGKRATEIQTESRPFSFLSGISAFTTVPRRRPLPFRMDTVTNMQAAIRSNPYAFIRVLTNINPTFGQALWNLLRFSLPESEELRIEVYEDGVLNEKDTQEINDFFENLPDEIGGLLGLCNTLLQDAYLSDKIMMECVPGEELTGLSEIWPLCPDSFIFARKDVGAKITVFQRQLQRKNNSWETQYIEFPEYRVLWHANDSSSDDVNGKIPFAPALLEVIRDTETSRDLSDAIRNAAYPTRVFKLNFSEMYKIAVEVFRKKSYKEAGDFVKEQFQNMKEYAKSVTPSDNVITDSSGGVDNLPAADFRGVEPGLEYLRQRLVSAVKSLPTLHGLGSDTSKNSIEYQLYALAAKAKRGEVFDLVSKACVLHFRLKGDIRKIKIIAPSIRINDELVEENTREVKLRTGILELAMGLITHEDLAYRMNGKKPVGKPMDGVIEAVTKAVGKPDQNGTKQTGKNNNANQGGTQGSPQAGG